MSTNEEAKSITVLRNGREVDSKVVEPSQRAHLRNPHKMNPNVIKKLKISHKIKKIRFQIHLMCQRHRFHHGLPRLRKG
ncbi:hypothetical protein FRX31_008984 [Thalictrum thalictroides]|uniref:Uncharacterized protein n=1 Tax=Thalictrum thalictroides TaxID=46969 RepID=A0A7J6WY80_THATH|nr:hypothetical protein FRX31_008984 [Thalictrum thalictroides]